MNKLQLLLLPGFFAISTIVNAQSNGDTGHLKVVVADENGQSTPVRIKLTDQRGYATALPPEVVSIMYGRNDRPERYGYQPDSSFYINGTFSLDLLPGTYSVHLSKGVEYLDQSHVINIGNGGKQELAYQLKRWVNMQEKGWYAADDDIHIRRSPRENPLILKWVEAEGLNVGVMLQMGDFWATYFSQYAFGDKGMYRENERMLTTGQEDPRTHEIGHTIAMVADDYVRFKNEYYYYDKVFDKVHELNGITGYAHQGMSFNGKRGMTLDVLRGKVDFLELLQFCVEGGPLITDNYYHFLDLGYKLTATAGSDFPWCGTGPRFGTNEPDWNARIGNARFYTHIEGAFEYASWKDNLKDGHTFVTSGPMLIFDVEGQLPGDEINLSKSGSVTVSAAAFGHSEQVPLTRLEIISHGKVIREVTPSMNNQTDEELKIAFDLPVDKGMWIAARCYAGLNQVAHTTPVYVTINGQGFKNSETVDQYLDLNMRYLEELEKELEQPNDHVNERAWWYKKGLKQRIEETRIIIESLR